MGGKRPWNGNLDRGIEGNPNKRNNQDKVKSYTEVAKEGRKPYRGTLPQCGKCGAHHLGEACRETICYRCGGKGHIVRDCRESKSSKMVCYHCGAEGHLRNACPKYKKKGKQTASAKQG